MIAVGQPAPDFEAPNQDNQPLRLSSLRGHPVVLYFYPKADTPGCTIEAKGFESHLKEFTSRGVRVVGVSVDDCPAQRAFATKYGLEFPLIADHAKTVSNLYGVLGPHGAARRVTYLIDAQGKVAEVVEGSPDTHVDRARARFLTA